MFRDAKCFPFVNDVLAEQLHLGWKSQMHNGPMPR
jgi:hypothetical protein